MQNDGHDELDRILDSALASYCAPQPWPGIEQRVIARLPQPKPHDAWLRWVLPAPVLAGVLAMIAYWVKLEPPRVNVPQAVVQSTVPAGRDVRTPGAASVTKAGRLGRPAVQPGTAQTAVFPTPSPLTAEERALIQLASSNPEVLQSVQIAEQHQSQPLTVEPIKIAPLGSSDSMED